MITFQPKIWQRKVANKYTSIRYDDINEDLYAFKSFDNCITLPVKSIKNLNTFSNTLNCVKIYDTNKLDIRAITYFIRGLITQLITRTFCLSHQ